jgi:hypothetical protein
MNSHRCADFLYFIRNSCRIELQELTERYANLRELAKRGEATEEAIGSASSMIGDPYSGAELFMKYHGLARERCYLKRLVQQMRAKMVRPH